MSIAVFILAGGSGIRLWPVSREEKPKQFLPLFPDGSSFFEKTLYRAKKLTSPENIYVLTRDIYSEFVKNSAPEIPVQNILTEATKKNTAPACAYAMMQLHKKQGNTTVVIMPSDHYITDDEIFTKTVKKACLAASESQGLVTIGIPPTAPAVTYGYIEHEKCSATDSVFKGISFTEKPDLKTAQKFLCSGNFLWNSGIFIWDTSAILNAFSVFAPGIYTTAQKMCECSSEETRNLLYSEMPCVSVDYAILEKAENIYVLKGGFGWNDIGSWTGYESILTEDSDGNRSDKNSTLTDTHNCTAISLNSKTVVIGADNLFVINTGDTVFIFPKDKADKTGNLADFLPRTE